MRRALSPVFATAGALIGVVIVQTIVGLASTEAAEAVNWLVLGALLTVPLSFLYGLLRSRLGATTRRLVAELSEKRTPEEVQTILRRALRDQTLELGYLGSPDFSYVGVDERPLQLPGADNRPNRHANRRGDPRPRRVASESLANVAKYAAASRACVELTRNDACSSSRSPTTASAAQTPARDPASED